MKSETVSNVIPPVLGTITALALVASGWEIPLLVLAALNLFGALIWACAGGVIKTAATDLPSCPKGAGDE
jgi:hypothetical protein